MRYWDSSALVPLCVEEASTPHMRQLLAMDPIVITWWTTELECVSAISRLEREGRLSPQACSEALHRLQNMGETWNVVEPVVGIRNTARRLLRVHPIRTADALQLAAAILSCRNQPRAFAFVCLDERLSEAAEREGFSIIRA